MGKVAFYNRALGGFEAYGLNNNGDGWLEDELRNHHGTFTENGHYFYNHKNNVGIDPAYGKPIASAFNEKTKMVDLIILADLNKQAQEDIHTLENGGSIPTSMGCRVKFDVCTICGNQAKTRDEYCCHISKTASYPYGMKSVLSDGRICGVLNPNPKFHDISRLPERPAFVGSEHMLKVARDHSYDIFEREDTKPEKMASVAPGQKTADMVKRIPGHVTSALVPSSKAIEDMRASVRSMTAAASKMPVAGIRKRAAEMGLGSLDLMMGSIASGVVLSPYEFGVLMGQPSGGDYDPSTMLDMLPHVPMGKVAIHRGSPAATELFLPFVDDRSCMQPYLFNRLVDPIYRPSTMNKVGSSGPASDMYHCYRALFLSCIDRVPPAMEVPIIKLAGTASRLLTPSSIAFAMLAFSGDSVPEIAVDKLAKTSSLGDTGYRMGRISGGEADMIGLKTLELMTEMSMEVFQRRRQ